jgi:hypothetical protein
MSTRATVQTKQSTAPVLLHVTVSHEKAMLSRITTVLSLYDVAHFTYRATTDGCAQAVISVGGTVWDARRVAAKIARLIGVLDVRADGDSLF